jgi:hypothetical protein
VPCGSAGSGAPTRRSERRYIRPTAITPDRPAAMRATIAALRTANSTLGWNAIGQSHKVPKAGIILARTRRSDRGRYLSPETLSISQPWGWSRQEPLNGNAIRRPPPTLPY